MVLELLLPGTPGLQGDDGNVITLGLPGGERVAGGDRAPAGTPTGLQCSSGFMCQLRGTASAARKEEMRFFLWRGEQRDRDFQDSRLGRARALLRIRAVISDSC